MPYPKEAAKRGGQNPASELQIISASKVIFKTKPWLAPKNEHCRAIASQNSAKPVFKHVIKSWESPRFESEVKLCEAVLDRFKPLENLTFARKFHGGYYRINFKLTGHKVETKTPDGRVSIVYWVKRSSSAAMQHKFVFSGSIGNPIDPSGIDFGAVIAQEFRDRHSAAKLAIQSAIDDANRALAELLAAMDRC